jgi:hypothetical protein
MSFIRALICVTAVAMIGAAGTGYHGDYRVENLEIRYDVPDSLIGPPVFTFAGSQFRDASDLRIFVSSYMERHLFREVPGAGGVFLGLSPFPKGLSTKHDLAAYAEFYERHAAERGLRARVTLETISGVDWACIEESYKNGNLARVIHVTPILPNYQLVCRVGLSDDLNPETKTRWPEWKPAMADLMQSIQFVGTKTEGRPKGLGLSCP